VRRARVALTRLPAPQLRLHACGARGCSSQLLQRAACALALDVPFERVVLSRTKGGKPFLVRPRAVPRSRRSRHSRSAALTRGASGASGGAHDPRAKLELQRVARRHVARPPPCARALLMC
jgi:hypothetical protein